MADDDKEDEDLANCIVDRIETRHRDPECPIGNIMREIQKQRAPAEASRSGPAQVATPEYRKNWTSIFGAKQAVGQA